MNHRPPGTTWSRWWRPAGGWPFYAVVLVAATLLGSGTAYGYYAVTKPPAVKVITPPAQVIHTTIRAPVPRASTRIVTEPPVTVQPGHPLPAARPQGTPQPSLTPHHVPSSGSANIPGISGWVPPSATGGEPPPDTNTPTPGVTAPEPVTTSPSQGGF